MKLAISHAYLGLMAAIEEVLKSTWHCCPLPFTRNVLPHLEFLREHRTKLHTADTQNPPNGKVTHRSDVIGIFPNEAIITCLVGALLLKHKNE